MSCKLTKLSSFKERLSTIENILFYDDFNSPVPSSINEWTTSESFHDDPHDDPTFSSSSKISIPKTLNDCLIASSPSGDLIVFAYGKNVAIFRYREEKETQICGTTLFEMEPGEKITSLICLPFVSQQISNQCRSDWCAIILGFSSGYLRIYTENFTKLLTQKISSESITSIKVNSFLCPYTSGRIRHSNCNKNVDEIFIFCRTFCMIIDGFVFYQTLRSCRNYIPRNRQCVPDIETHPEFALRFKTWLFKDCDRIFDADNCGSHEISDYDWLVSRSISKGTFRSPYNRQTNGNLIISTGEDPFIGLRRADEIDSTSVLEEVTQAVVNKVKNVLPTFLRSTEKPKPKVDPPLDFSSNLELYDQYRIGVKICISPTREMAAVCDEFGRVCLVNLSDGLVIRMWKGYRDAQCGWIESYENPDDYKSRKITFLCIYAPKRGLLEVWRCQHGPRVHAFNVGKSCRLLYCGYSMLGLNDVLIKQYRKNFGPFLLSPDSCYLIDCESCDIYTFQVPFVVGLTDRFNQSSKDELLYKEFTNIPIDINNSENFISIFDKIKTHQIKWQAIDFIIGHSMVSLVKDLCQTFTSQLPDDQNTSSDIEPKTDPMVLSSAQRCQKMIQLCQFYQSFEQLVKPIANVTIVSSFHQDSPDIESQSELLGWSDRDYARYVSFFSLKEVVLGSGQEVKLNPDCITFAELVDFFLPKQEDQLDESSSRSSITPKKKVFQLEQLHRVGDFILIPGLFSENLEVCAGHIESLTFIAPQEILYCLFASWLHIDFTGDWRYWPRFNRYVSLIVNMLRQKHANGSDQWLRILKIVTSLIAQSSLIPSALIASMVLLTLYSEFDLCEEATPSSKLKATDDEQESCIPEEWENLSIVKEKLSLLINQLESTFFLSLTLHSNVNYDPGRISLSSLRESLPGIVSESIAKWAISYPLNPSIITSLEGDDDSDDENKINSVSQITFGTDIVASQEESTIKIDTTVIQQLLSKVRDQFPRSMESDVILANCAWECLILWDKDPSMGATSTLLFQSLKYLEPLSSAVLKHNLCCLIWKIAIRKRLETLSSLIEKMGKTPKDRILRKDIGLGEGSLEEFLKFVTELLDLILETIGPSQFDAMPIFRLDDWWKNREWTSRQFPLVFIAIQQQPANPQLTVELFDLILVVTLIVNFQIKHFKPLSLFPYDVAKTFFDEISSPLPPFQPDSLLIASREKFLLAAASAVAYSVPPAAELVEEDAHLYSTANQWIGKIVGLCKHWDIQPDSTRQRYVCDLYANCCDVLAQEYTSTINDREALAVVLLPVAGLRVRHLIRSQRGKFLASTPQSIMQWLEEIPSKKEINLNFTVETTTKMLDYIISFLPSGNYDKRIARNLLEMTNNL
ncbi:rab3 GTPase-activating protein non-catalytic subunit-like [Panonychus citri]|uniref:rab3 GTPase-activating protein non-catalytic subunit-like n=1 Tax=Panonychus citri TaxID=50023 RepID=UPI00230813CC|nr:rab3 GTPase-activating protein non-catalytic subunit-like [Panonychus citri]